jgi:FAD/FMN-containing dehydrogenase
MSKISEYLQQHITGEIATDPATRLAFSRDNSILELTPQIVVYPRTTNDVRKVTRFAWRLAERGQVLPLTARGGGTSTTGSAITSGTVLAFAAHMSRILELDVKSRMVRVQPGLNMAALSEAMATQGLFLPVAPDDQKAATVGGALAANVTSAKSVKYGSLRDWVDRVEVVLANGEIIQTERLSKRDLSAKKGLQTMEGEVYRALDTLIDENTETIDSLGANATFGINLVKESDGSFDLTPLMIGSEGSLGIITQSILRLEPRPDEVELIAAAITHEQDLAELTLQILELEPSELEFIDGDTLKLIEQKGGGSPWRKITQKRPASLIFVEFDDKHRSKKTKKLAKLLSAAGVADAIIASSFEDQELLRSVHASVATITNFSERGVTSLPIAQDLSVEPARVAETVAYIKKILVTNHLEGGIWGSLGAGLINVRPLLNLASLGQRQAIFKFMDKIQELAVKLNGLSSGGFDDGRLHAPFIGNGYDEDTVKLFQQLKLIFDPFSTLNPGVKLGLSQDDLVKMLRQDYEQARFSQFNLRG